MCVQAYISAHLVKEKHSRVNIGGLYDGVADLIEGWAGAGLGYGSITDATAESGTTRTVVRILSDMSPV